jgi:hypothetical protein
MRVEDLAGVVFQNSNAPLQPLFSLARSVGAVEVEFLDFRQPTLKLLQIKVVLFQLGIGEMVGCDLFGDFTFKVVAGPFNYLGSCGTLKERYRHEWRNDGLPWSYWRPVGESFRKIAIGKGNANLKEQVCPAY